MHSRWFTLSIAGALLCTTMAFADGPKQPTLERYTGPVQMVKPTRIMKVRWENGRAIPVSPWIELGDFAPAGPCNDPNETLVFSTGPLDEAGNWDANCQVCASGSGFWFGETYSNPYYAGGIVSLSDASFNGANAVSLAHAWAWQPTDPTTCYVLIVTTEEFDEECQDVHENSAIDGVLLEYQNLAAGIYVSSVCLSSAGINLALPSTSADDGDPGTELLGGWSVAYGEAYDTNTGQLTLASFPSQPFLWDDSLNTAACRRGDSAGNQFDDDNPTDGDHDPASECFNYAAFDLSGFGCPNPSELNGIIAFWAAPSCTPNGGDVDGSGCIDDADLLAVLFAFGGSGGPEDVNCDGSVDDADLLTVLFNFGTGC